MATCRAVCEQELCGEGRVQAARHVETHKTHLYTPTRVRGVSVARARTLLQIHAEYQVLNGMLNSCKLNEKYIVTSWNHSQLRPEFYVKDLYEGYFPNIFFPLS